MVEKLNNLAAGIAEKFIYFTPDYFYSISEISENSFFQIIFYEGYNFQGRSYECSEDCPDTYRHFNCCNSIRVMGGHWVGYEKPNYMGYQYVLGRGEYPHFHHWMGFNNCIRSCQMFAPVSQSN